MSTQLAVVGKRDIGGGGGAKDEVVECVICGNDYLLTRVVICSKCEIEVCHTCAKNWLLSDESEPRCCNAECNTPWSSRFLWDNLGNRFINKDLRGHTDKMLIARVKATNHLYTKEAKYLRKCCEIDKMMLVWLRKIREVDRSIHLCRQTYTELLANGTDIYDEVMVEISIERSELEVTRERYKKGHTDAKENYRIYKEKHELGNAKTTNTHKKPCPHPTCNGFLSKKGDCCICNKHICMKCDVEIVANTHSEDGRKLNAKELKSAMKCAVRRHICKEDDLETVKALKADTMACPRCHALISKIDGCNQMYCTACEKSGQITVFSWDTGEIETGRIHNPHYIEYLRKQDQHIRAIGDVYCGGIPPIELFARAITTRLPQHVVEVLLQHHRAVNEFVQYAVDPQRTKMRNMYIHRETQIQYIAGQISEKKFIKKVSFENELHKCDREILDIYEVILAVMTEQLNGIFNSPTYVSFTTYLAIVTEFLKNENQCCRDLANIYGGLSIWCGLTMDSDTWELDRTLRVSS